MAADIYLSPRKILEHLCLLEEKIPRFSSTPYHPTGSLLNSEEGLNCEVKAMLAHIGMGNYVPQCEFTQLQDNVAGCVEMGGKMNNLIRIRVDEKYRGKNRVILAILAHEICHKLIYMYGIDFPMMQIANEVYTDLCTLYVGFGELIINGYKTTINSANSTTPTTVILGYLQYDMYVDTYEIIRCIYGGYPYRGNTSNDIFLEEVIALFNSSDNKKSLIVESLKKKESEFSELQRNLLILKQILEKYYTCHSDDIKHYSDTVMSSGLFGKSPTQQNRIRVLKSLYDLEVGEKTTDNIKTYIKYVEKCITTLGTHCQFTEEEINYGIVKCPCCGHVSKNDIQCNNTSVILCHKCGIMFTKNTSKIEYEKWVHERTDMIREEQNNEKRKQEIQEQLTQLHSDKSILEHEMRKFSAYKISIEDQAVQKVQKVKSDLLQEGRLQMWNDMPHILKWLTKKYLYHKKKDS